MLVLSRRVGEKIYIDDNITLEVKSIDRNVVRLGFVAPPEVSIMRKELLDQQARVDEIKKQQE